MSSSASRVAAPNFKWKWKIKASAFFPGTPIEERTTKRRRMKRRRRRRQTWLCSDKDCFKSRSRRYLDNSNFCSSSSSLSSSLLSRWALAARYYIFEITWREARHCKTLFDINWWAARHCKTSFDIWHYLLSSKRSSSSIFNDFWRSDRGNQSLNNIISGFSLTLLGTLCLSRRRWVFDHKWGLHTIDNAIVAQRLNSNSSPSRPVEKKVCIVSHLSYLRWLCALCDYSRFGCVDSPFYGNLRNCQNKLSATEKMCYWWRVASKRFTRLSLVVMSKRHLLHCMHL